MRGTEDIHSILGIEYAWWRRQKVSCAWRWWSLLPMIFNVLTFVLMASGVARI